MSFYAIDFGTSNSLLNHVSGEGQISQIMLGGDDQPILRSLLFTSEKNKWFFGEEAIEQYVEQDGEGRFFRSLKKFLPESSFTGTEVHNKKMKITELIGTFLREMREKANKVTGEDVTKVVMGRPALYSLDKTKDQLAEDRMREACHLAGFDEVHFCPEPLAAGLDYDRGNTENKNVLVADFGGGTSDFTLMKLHEGTYSQDDILGLSGIFKAGDALDGETMLKFISKHFGSQFEYKVPFGNNILKFPRILLKKICSPAHITQLRERETWAFLQEIQKLSIDEKSKQQLDQLFTLVECQLGFPIFDEIEKLKVNICTSTDDSQVFDFDYLGVKVNEEIESEKYFEALSPVVENILESLNEVFKQSGLTPGDVDQVCLTGGTAQFTLIKRKLEDMFGKEKLIEHNIYQSVVGGLSEYALSLESEANEN